MTRPGTSAIRPPVRNPGPPTAALPTPAAPMWWDGGDRAITAREKARIEEHGPSCFSIALVPATDSATVQQAPAIPDGLDQVYKALDLAADGPFFYVGAQTAAGVGTHFQAQPGSFRLFCGDASFANAHAIVAALNWLRENREALTATCKQPLQVGEVQEYMSELLAEMRDVEDYFKDVDPNPIHLATIREAISALAATGKQQVGEVSEGAFRASASRQTANAESNETAEAMIAHARAQVGEVYGDALIADAMVDAACKVMYHGYEHESRKAYREACQKDARQALEAALAARPLGAQLAVWCGPMPESNGRQNWTAMLYRKGGDIFGSGSITIDRSENPDQVRYEADRLRYLIGEIHEEPDILKYDASLHSGYVEPPAQGIDLGTGVKAIAAERERQLQAEGFTRDGDQQYRRGELAKAATAYVQLAAMDLEAGTRDHIAWHGPAAAWPWAPWWWKPVDARRDLVRAGALIAAQIDLIDQRDAAPGVANA